MRSSIAESITSTVKDLKKSGLVDEITMKNIQSLCVPAVKEYKPEKIVAFNLQYSIPACPGWGTTNPRGTRN